MEPNNPLIERQLIVDLLYGDENYMKEFAEASVDSFTEFQQHFKEALIKNDEIKLRNAGHKIKPVAQMMNLYHIVEMYEKSKDLIGTNNRDEIKQLIREMDTYCGKLLVELKEFI
ncbi:MAG: taurine dioxygenase [Balneolaceae bacterium]|nr:MAG: taurine dioxygenase [Balneolaceae bacterium]